MKDDYAGVVVSRFEQESQSEVDEEARLSDTWRANENAQWIFRLPASELSKYIMLTISNEE